MRAYGAVAALFLAISIAPGYALQKSITPDLSAIADAASWTIHHASAAVVQIDGRKAVRLIAEGDSAQGFVGLAVANGMEFDTGTIEIDLKGMGGQKRCFLGVAFNVSDEKTFEAVYFRPFNFTAEGESKDHAVQYIAWPLHPWDELRKDKPHVFEAPISPVLNPDDWFHARIEVGETQVRVFVNDVNQPCLTVDRLLKGGQRQPIGLFVDSHEGMYDNLKIMPNLKTAPNQKTPSGK